MTPTEFVHVPYEFDRPIDLRPVESGDRRVYADLQFAIVPGFRPLVMDLTVPHASGPVPVVVTIHGGAWLTGSHKSAPSEIAGYPELWDLLIAAGCATASIQYRHSAEAPFPAQLHDAKAAVRWLRRYGAELGVDPSRIGALGDSAGGFLSVYLGLNVDDPWLEGNVGTTGVPSTVAAAVAWYPPTQLDTLDAHAVDDAVVAHDAPDSPESRLLGFPLRDDRARARRASPVSHVSRAAAPMLLIHGSRDRVVPPDQSVVLRDLLREVGSEVELIVVEGADHVFAGTDPSPLIARTARFLVSALGSGR